MAVFASAGIHGHHRPPCAIYSDDIDRSTVPYFPPAAGSDSHDIVHPEVGDPHTYFQQQRRTKKKLTYEQAPVRQCAIIQIIVGFTLVITSFVMMKHDAWGRSNGIGFWGCIFYFSAGLFGFLASKYKNTCCIIGSTLSSLLTCFISLAVIVIESIGINIDSTDVANSKLALHAINVVLGLLGTISAYVQLRRGSRYLCRGIRDRKSDVNTSNVPSINGSRNTLSRPDSLDSVTVANLPPETPCHPLYVDCSPEEPPPSYEEVMKHHKPSNTDEIDLHLQVEQMK